MQRARTEIELVYRQAQEAKGSAAGPDYSSTLGVITEELQAVTARLDAIEHAPALATTPAQRATGAAAGAAPHRQGRPARAGAQSGSAPRDRARVARRD